MWYSLGVKNNHKTIDDTNLTAQTAAVFIEYYNKNIPATFPRATTKNLDEFRSQYASLFKESNDWTINKHRKKFMDWLGSHREDKK